MAFDWLRNFHVYFPLGMILLQSYKNHQLNKISPHADGVLAPGSAHARPSARPPIDMSGNFSPHVSAE